MSFHPLMVYGSERFQKSERARLDEGPPFEFTRERRAIESFQVHPQIVVARPGSGQTAAVGNAAFRHNIQSA